MYLDDIKIYSKSHEMMCHVVSKTKKRLKDIGFIVNLRKSGAFQKKGVDAAEDIILEDNTVIPKVSSQAPYKYLGIWQAEQFDMEKIKEMVFKEFRERCNKITRSCLSAHNTIKAINTYAIGYLRYFFCLKFPIEDLKDLIQIVKTSLVKSALNKS